MNKLIYKIIVVAFVLTSCNNTSIKKLPDLGLGLSNLKQKTTHKNLAQGVLLYNIERGITSNDDFYTLSTGVITKANEKELANKLKTLGYNIRIEQSAESGPHHEFLGNIIRVGKYNTIDEAKMVQKDLENHKINMAVRYTAEDGNTTSGPFQISLLEINLNIFKGNMFSELGNHKILGKENTSSMAKRLNAIAAINAGFFAWNNEVGIDGEPAGISIIDGKLVSEATQGRSALIIDNNLKKMHVAHNVKTNISLHINDTIFRVNGINREHGKVLNCGNQIDSTAVIPIHDFVCNNPNEIIAYNANFGGNIKSGEGFEFVIDENNLITSINAYRKGFVPKKGYLIQATGNAQKHLKDIAELGIKSKLKIEVTSDEGSIGLKKGIYAINGGPTLLQNNKANLTARYKEGWETMFNDFNVSDEFVDKKDKASINDQQSNNRFGFYHGWVVRRHPRTAIGITKDNKIYIAVVYGRQPKITAGASITEMTMLMKKLGCTEAFNLDGGGSSMMVVNNKKTGKSSDLSGERAIGDALIFTE